MPVIAHGGAGSPEDVGEVLKKGKADAVAIASILHYQFIREEADKDASFSEEGNVSFLKSGKTYNKIKPCTIGEVKNHLKSIGLAIR